MTNDGSCHDRTDLKAEVLENIVGGDRKLGHKIIFEQILHSSPATQLINAK